MRTITVTSKRQATLPIELCRELGIAPGDKIAIERVTLGDESVWVLRARKPDWSWLGSLRAYAEGKDHDWDAIEASIAQGIGGREP